MTNGFYSVAIGIQNKGGEIVGVVPNVQTGCSLILAVSPSFSTRGVRDPGSRSRTTSWSKGLHYKCYFVVMIYKVAKAAGALRSSNRPVTSISRSWPPLIPVGASRTLWLYNRKEHPHSQLTPKILSTFLLYAVCNTKCLYYLDSAPRASYPFYSFIPAQPYRRSLPRLILHRSLSRNTSLS